MKLEKKLYILLPILFVIAVAVGYFTIINTDNSKDALKFKEEYEKLNNTNAYSDKKYNELKISEDNPIKYSNYDEILNIIDKGTGIIYLGFPECPWCRSVLPILFDVASDNRIKNIYYLNIKNERDSLVVEDGKLVYELDDNGNEKKGTEGYFKLLKALDKYLTEYTISFEEEVYETGEKRIYAPTVIFVKDGKVLGLHVSTVESHKSGFDKMTEEQKEELYSIYEEYILEIKNSTCSSNSSC